LLAGSQKEVHLPAAAARKERLDKYFSCPADAFSIYIFYLMALRWIWSLAALEWIFSHYRACTNTLAHKGAVYRQQFSLQGGEKRAPLESSRYA
jgi:hypothetical protein